jgi:hypothetical protein
VYTVHTLARCTPTCFLYPYFIKLFYNTALRCRPTACRYITWCCSRRWKLKRRYFHWRYCLHRCFSRRYFLMPILMQAAIINLDIPSTDIFARRYFCTPVFFPPIFFRPLFSLSILFPTIFFPPVFFPPLFFLQTFLLPFFSPRPPKESTTCKYFFPAASFQQQTL